MTPFPQAFVTFASALSAAALNALWQDALLVVSIALLLRLWPSINAATRYTVWSATLVAAFVIPLATTFAFFASPQAPATAARTHVAQRAGRVVANSAPAPRAASPTGSMRAPTKRLPERVRVTLPVPLTVAIFVVWAALAAYAVVKLSIGLIHLERLKRDALPLPVEYRDAMPQWTRANKGARDVRLCVSDATDVPVAVGLFDAMILVPHSLLDRLSEGEVDQICLHELAHLRRADDWTNGVQRLIIALLAWNPAAQFIGQQLDLEREVACDDWVLSFVGVVRPYALCLTKMAEESTWPRHPMPAPGVFATRKHISLRIERLLGAGRNVATNLSPAPTAAAVAAVAAVALAIGVVAPTVAAPTVAAPRVAAPTVTAPIAAAPTAAAAAAVRSTPSAAPVQPPSPAARAIVVRSHAVTTPSHAIVAPSRALAMRSRTIELRSQTVPLAPVDTPHLGEALAKDVLANVGATVGAVSAAVGNGRSCYGCHFDRVDWSGRNLHGVNYNGVKLAGAQLVGTDFSGGNFNGVDFSKSNLRRASFRNAHLLGCDFSGADLTGADFTGARLSACQFTGAQLTTASLRGVVDECTGCGFSRANLSGLDLSNVRLSDDDFSGADLSGANLSGAVLIGVNFRNARMDGVNASGATFNACDLAGVDVAHVDLSRAKLIDTDLPSRRRSTP